MCPICFGPAGDCPVFLIKRAKSFQPRVVCTATNPGANADDNDSMVNPGSMQACKKSTDSSPASEHPIICPECYPDLADSRHKPEINTTVSKRLPAKRAALRKSQFAGHWVAVHDCVPMPGSLKADIQLADCEEARLRINRGFPLTKAQVDQLKKKRK